MSVSFRWRVSSQDRFDFLRYFDKDGQRSPATEGVATGDRFLSGEVAWRGASFDYFGNGSVGIEWCYIKNRLNDRGDDAGYLDRLQINPPNHVIITPSQVPLSEGSSAALTVSLAETPQSNVTVSLTVPAESANDIAVSPAQVVLSPAQPTMLVTLTASEDGNAEARETHVVRAQSPVAAATMITVITSPRPPAAGSSVRRPGHRRRRTARHSQPATAARRCGRLSQTAMRSGALRCATK